MAHDDEPVPRRQQVRTYLTLVRRRPAREQRRFVVFAQGRTGSTLLVDLLRSSPGVHCDDEILARRVAAPSMWIAAHRARHRDAVGYGFKVKIYQLTDAQGVQDPGRWLREMHGRGWSVVSLVRRNLLRHVLSNMVAEQRGSFVYRGASPPPVEALHVDPRHLTHWMGVRAEVGRAERATLAGVPHVSVSYEDDLLDAARHQATLDRLCAHLELPAATARTDVRRTVAESLPEVIANYHEVRAALAGTEWATYFDE